MEQRIKNMEKFKIPDVVATYNNAFTKSMLPEKTNKLPEFITDMEKISYCNMFFILNTFCHSVQPKFPDKGCELRAAKHSYKSFYIQVIHPT